MRWTTWTLPFAMAEQTSLLACKIQVTNQKRSIVCNHRLIRQVKVTTPSVALQEMSQESYIRSHQEILSFGLRFFNRWILKNIMNEDWSSKWSRIVLLVVLGLWLRSSFDFDLLYDAWPWLLSLHLRWRDECWKQLAVGMCIWLWN